MRSGRGRIIAAIARRTGDLTLAEEAVQEAAMSALVHWHRNGPPRRPDAWLIRVAFRKAIDRLRGQAREERNALAMMVLARDEATLPEDRPIADDRLALIFTCCHPVLDPKSRIALTLRTVAGLSTADIARAFLDQETTMGQRLSRAKARIAAAGIPFEVPGPEEWPARLNSVLTVIYLVFNEGHAAALGEAQVRASLCDEAIFLGRLMVDLTSGAPEAAGLLSLMLTTHARRPARTGPSGAMIALEAQDRSLWDRALVAEGLDLLDRALVRLDPGPHQIKAAISALHVQAQSHAETDWRQMLLLYDSLLRFEPTPVVRLNRAVVLAELGGLSEALKKLEELSGVLDRYQPFHAVRAEFLARAGQRDAAGLAYERAISLSRNDAERAFLRQRAKALKD